MKLITSVCFAFLLFLSSLQALPAYSKGEISSAYVDGRCFFINKDKTGNKMKGTNWTYTWPYFINKANGTDRRLYKLDATGNKYIPIFYQMAGPAREFVFTKQKIEDLLEELKTANKKYPPERLKPGDAPYNKLPDGYTINDIDGIFLDSAGSCFIYKTTQKAANNVLVESPSISQYNSGCIYITDIEFRGNEVWAFVMPFNSGDSTENFYPIGVMRIDDKLMTTTGYCIQFYLKYKDIHGSITSDRKSVKPGEKVNISWDAKIN
jgi:hypothetical protein